MSKDFDGWNKKKKIINEIEFSGYISERDVWWCSIGLNIGSEEDGKNEEYERPVLIIKKFNRRMVLVVPLTTKLKDEFYHFRFFGNGREHSAILSQIRILSTSRLTRHIWRVDEKIFKQLCENIINKLFRKIDSRPFGAGSPGPKGHSG